ncbi:MAG: hypothetical protein Q8O56_06190 [Solirubrobacteraceae bacterium]|nr:hypothetical protein [Solirubrobacteraceae bacterium]
MTDIEAVIGDYLRSHPDITAIVGSRVGARTPHDLSEPWIRFALLTESTSSRPLHRTTATLQLDCYAGSDETIARGQAARLARATRTALEELATAAVASAVISAVSHLALRPLPDDDLKPPRERFILTEEVILHP